MKVNEYNPLQREYAKLASLYDSRWKNYIEASIHETLKRVHVAPEDQILDVGCGTGALLKSLTLKSPLTKLTGVDLSGEMLKVARQRLGSGIDLEQACSENLPFDDAMFDLVVSTSALHYFRKPMAALKERFRVLKPSGKIIITDWCNDFLSIQICDMILRTFNSGHYRTYSSMESRKIMTEAGFMGVEVERYRITWLWGLMTATATKHAI